ncbi:SEC-C metal-binding domain-containing protein [Halomonas sp.]|uniref:SEC-C metal-binding domain-containing protein n=1 Tax=Halomonas sp. TaxID=1486246 RepID=UPI00298D6ADB|nr:SEC-C metal-binding domain-containing protein [Halomonas sp.]MDW7745657.1 SEC-C metal-binding domain-containing protein [Halomonas sp.]
MQPDDLPEIPAELDQAILAFFQQSIRHILRHEDAERYFQALDEIVRHSGMTEWFDPNMPWWELGLTVWNATPLPSQGFRSATLPLPRRNDPCPCGSGKKYKRCCLPLQNGHAMDLTEEIPIARMAISLFTQQQRQAASRQAPAPIRLLVAEHELEQGHPGKARKLLLALLRSGGLDDEAQTHAVQLLGDAYDALGHQTAGEKAFVELVPGLKPMAAAAALYWLSGRTLEDDRPADALAHLLYAEHLAPDNLINGLLKVVCLRALGEDAEARRTAQEWLPLAQDLDDTQAIELLQAQLGPAPFEGFDDAPDDAEDIADENDNLLSLFGPDAATLTTLTELLEDALHQPLHPVRFEPGPPDSKGSQSRWVMMAAEQVAQTNALLFHDPNGIDPLDPTLIRHHPDLLQNPAFLEALDAHAGLALNDAQAAFNQALAQQVDRLLDHILAALPAGGQLPWEWLEHRPVLRLMQQRAVAEHDLQAAIDGLSYVLSLCPNDNLGVRAPLINSLLRAGHDTEALAVAEQYLEDHLAETRYGRVLALVRLGRLHEAEQALREAYAALPKVLNYLIAKKRKQPKLNPQGMVIGGNDQAWYYREEMRDVFLETPGMIGWLESTKKRLPPPDH